MVHEKTALTRGGEFTSVVVHPVKPLDVVHYLPRLLRPEERYWKADGMEGNVILAHELDITDVRGPFILTPPASPVTACSFGPFHGSADIFDRSVEPDVEDLSFKTRTHLALISYRNTPGKVASDA